MLIGVVNLHEPVGLVVAFDPPPPTFRHELYPEYKSNRPEPPEEFLDECDELERLLRSNDVAVCKVAGFEADDVLGTLSDKASKMGRQSLIYTCDLDLLQVLDEHTEVEVFSQYRVNRTFDTASATRRFNGISPLNIPDLKALMGDRSDNLPGVPGIGEKSATTILLETRDIETLYADLERVTRLPIRGSKRIFRILSEHKDDAFLMKRLATILRDVPIDIDIFGADVRSFDLDAIVTV
jgi:DNA polymerase-1